LEAVFLSNSLVPPKVGLLLDFSKLHYLELIVIDGDNGAFISLIATIIRRREDSVDLGRSTIDPSVHLKSIVTHFMSSYDSDVGLLAQ